MTKRQQQQRQRKRKLWQTHKILRTLVSYCCCCCCFSVCFTELSLKQGLESRNRTRNLFLGFKKSARTKPVNYLLLLVRSACAACCQLCSVPSVPLSVSLSHCLFAYLYLCFASTYLTRILCVRSQQQRRIYKAYNNR